jgi:hypothetical protein
MNELDDTSIVSLILKRGQWMLVHTVLPTFFIMIIQQSSKFLIYLKFLYKRVFILFFIYFLYAFLGIIGWECIEILLSSAGKQICDWYPNCFSIFRLLYWFFESGLGNLSDIVHGCVAIIFILLIQFKSGIYSWGYVSNYYAIKRIIYMLALGIWSNASMFFIVIDPCKPQVPTDISEPWNVFPIGVIVMFYGYLVALHFLEREDIFYRPELKENIRVYYTTWRIYLILQILCCSNWVIGTFITIFIAWTFMFIFIFYFYIFDGWWIQEKSNQ